MKVDSVTIKTIHSRKRLKKADGAQGTFAFGQTSSASPTADTAELSSLTMSTILADMAIVPNEPNHHEVGVRRGKYLLKALRQLHLSFIGGGSALAECCRAIRDALAMEHKTPSSIELKETLEFIELRAAVELAKEEARDC